MKFLFSAYCLLSAVFCIYSYGFVDKNLHLSTNSFYTTIHEPLQHFVFEKRGWAGATYVVLIICFWIVYFLVLQKIHTRSISNNALKKLIFCVSVLFLFSFPAFSYDIFNYMLTAKVTYTYNENPWIVRPIEIPNEPSLAFTRAANKVALYGPTWIGLTYIPHVLGLNNVWLTIIMFKLLILIFFFFFLFLIWKITKNTWNVACFALNPLVLVTVLNEGHNDIVMMTLAVGAFMSVRYKVLLWLLSVFVKGATIILVLARSFRSAFWLMFLIFLISPLREEMYPWYFIWCLSFLVLLPKEHHRFLYAFSFALCFGLLLRNVPYIVTRQYEGYNQFIRTAVTWLPMIILVPALWSNILKKFLRQ
ncbi:MAG: hypothetical protein N3A54_04270 [Patescibacteria group bacterium]|nr:hypothetical protein [Patescibacteria group bacterium]